MTAAIGHETWRGSRLENDPAVSPGRFFDSWKADLAVFLPRAILSLKWSRFCAGTHETRTARQFFSCE